MKIEFFILKDSGLYYVKDMPEKLTASGIDAAIDSSIPVANQEELFNELCKNYPLMDSSSNEGGLMELECEVRVETKCSTCGNYDRCHEFGDSGKCSELIESAFVTFPGKEETKEDDSHMLFHECALCNCRCNCNTDPCSCDCTKEEAVTKEDEQHNLLFKFQRFLERTTGYALEPKSEDWMIDQNIKQFLKEFNLNN